MMPVFRPHSAANVERMEFAKKLINLMRDNNLNQADLARKSGLTRDAISTYVRARSMPEPANLAKLANSLGVEPSYFQLDYYRVAEKMANTVPFAADANESTVQRSVPTHEDQLNISVNADGSATVRIIATMTLEKATELMTFFKKVK